MGLAGKIAVIHPDTCKGNRITAVTKTNRRRDARHIKPQQSGRVRCRTAKVRRNQAIFMSQLTAIAELKREWGPLVVNGNAKKAPILQFSLRYKGIVA